MDPQKGRAQSLGGLSDAPMSPLQSPLPTTPTQSQSRARPSSSARSALTESDLSGSSISLQADLKDLQAAEGFWPEPDSEDSDAPAQPNGVKRSSKPGSSRFFRSMMQKFGRSFNKSYDYLPNDAQERDRNILQHRIITEVLDGKLSLAPVARPRRVLDVGTGPGLWVLDYAKKFPEATVIGVDVEPVRIPARPPNAQFSVADIRGKRFDEPFDHINVRMLGNVPWREELVNDMYENLQPGGWVEFTEWIMVVQSGDRAFEKTSLRRYCNLLDEGGRRLGMSPLYPTEYKGLLEKRGFHKVAERKYAVPLNPWAPGKRLKLIGEMMCENLLSVIDAISLPVFTHGLGWTPKDLESLLEKVRKEVGDTNYHIYCTLMTVYAQRPRDNAQSSSSSLQSMPSGRRPSSLQVSLDSIQGPVY